MIPLHHVPSDIRGQQDTCNIQAWKETGERDRDMCIAQTATSPQAKHENEGIDAMNVANVTGSPKVRWQVTVKSKEKMVTLLHLRVPSLRRGHANLLCIVPILTDDPRRESMPLWPGSV